jgi:hypothetical protein
MAHWCTTWNAPSRDAKHARKCVTRAMRGAISGGGTARCAIDTGVPTTAPRHTCVIVKTIRTRSKQRHTITTSLAYFTLFPKLMCDTSTSRSQTRTCEANCLQPAHRCTPCCSLAYCIPHYNAKMMAIRCVVKNCEAPHERICKRCFEKGDESGNWITCHECRKSWCPRHSKEPYFCTHLNDIADDADDLLSYVP